MSKHTELLLLALSLMALSLSPDFVAQGSSAGDIDTMHANKIGFQRMAPPLATADGVKQDMPRNEEVRKLFTKGLFFSVCSMKKKHVLNEEM